MEDINESTCAKCDGSLDRAVELGIVNFCKKCLDETDEFGEPKYLEWVSDGFFIGFRKRVDTGNKGGNGRSSHPFKSKRPKFWASGHPN